MEWLDEDTKKNPSAIFKERTDRLADAWKVIDKTKKEKLEALYKKELEDFNVANA